MEAKREKKRGMKRVKKRDRGKRETERSCEGD